MAIIKQPGEGEKKGEVIVPFPNFNRLDRKLGEYLRDNSYTEFSESDPAEGSYAIDLRYGGSMINVLGKGDTKTTIKYGSYLGTCYSQVFGLVHRDSKFSP